MKKLYRSTRNSVFAGVCGGIAEYLNIDATLIRVLMVVFTLFGFCIPLLLYIVMIFIVPKEPHFNYNQSNYYY